MPLEGLTVDEQGRLSYKGSTWGDMSSSEQLRVAAAVAHALKPECGFVLVDELERFDPDQLAEFGSWAEARGLQVIGTRVATDGTCTIVIEDGRVAGQELEQAAEGAPADAAQDAAQPADKKPDMRPALMPLVPGSF